MNYQTLILFLVFSLFSGETFAQSAKQTKRLDKGEILITLKESPGSEIPKVRLMAVIESSPKKVWKVISNCNKFKDRLPRILKSKTLKKGKRVVCEVVYDLPFPLSNLRAKTIELHQEGPKVWSRKWKLLDGDFDFDNGSWEVSSYKGDPNRSYVVYKVHRSPKTSIPASIRKMAQKSNLIKMVKAIRKHSKSL